MHKVIIVDDEPIIVEGLISIVNWAQFGCEVAGVAHDGVEGTALIRERKPDIVFTDIRMPDMDGLTMLAGLRSEFPDLRVCVLTGFRDFSYAQQAIKLGVTRYLLKPSNLTDITEALAAMCSQLGGEAADPAEETITAGANNFVVRNALAYIEQHYREKLTLADVASQAFVSQWHLSKLLNKHTGQNFLEILNGQRIKAATKLLADPSLRISDVSEMVGFVDVAHFSRVFRKFMDMSANEYRNHINA